MTRRVSGWADGVVLCATGYTTAFKDTVRRVVEDEGGRYSSSLSKESTHLIVSSTVRVTGSEKLRAAVRALSEGRWHLIPVQGKWLRACQACKQLVDTGPYVIEAASLAAAPADATGSPGAKPKFGTTVSLGGTVCGDSTLASELLASSRGLEALCAAGARQCLSSTSTVAHAQSMVEAEVSSGSCRGINKGAQLPGIPELCNIDGPPPVVTPRGVCGHTYDAGCKSIGSPAHAAVADRVDGESHLQVPLEKRGILVGHERRKPCAGSPAARQHAHATQQNGCGDSTSEKISTSAQMKQSFKMLSRAQGWSGHASIATRRVDLWGHESPLPAGARATSPHQHVGQRPWCIRRSPEVAAPNFTVPASGMRQCLASSLPTHCDWEELRDALNRGGGAKGRFELDREHRGCLLPLQDLACLPVSGRIEAGETVPAVKRSRELAMAATGVGCVETSQECVASAEPSLALPGAWATEALSILLSQPVPAMTESAADKTSRPSQQQPLQNASSFAQASAAPDPGCSPDLQELQQCMRHASAVPCASRVRPPAMVLPVRVQHRCSRSFGAPLRRDDSSCEAGKREPWKQSECEQTACRSKRESQESSVRIRDTVAKRKLAARGADGNSVPCCARNDPFLLQSRQTGGTIVGNRPRAIPDPDPRAADGADSAFNQTPTKGLLPPLLLAPPHLLQGMQWRLGDPVCTAKLLAHHSMATVILRCTSVLLRLPDFMCRAEDACSLGESRECVVVSRAGTITVENLLARVHQFVLDAPALADAVLQGMHKVRPPAGDVPGAVAYELDFM